MPFPEGAWGFSRKARLGPELVQVQLQSTVLDDQGRARLVLLARVAGLGHMRQARVVGEQPADARQPKVRFERVVDLLREIGRSEASGTRKR